MTIFFDYVNSINFSKKNLIEDEETEKSYVPFMVNRSLSYFPDTVAFANVMNQHHGIDGKLQYDFLLNIVRKRKRFSKWHKPETESDLEVVKEYYGYSNEKARAALKLLTINQLNIIKLKISKGGRKR